MIAQVVEKQLEKLNLTHMRRHLGGHRLNAIEYLGHSPPVLQEKIKIDLRSNDYLGLGNNSKLRDQARAAIGDLSFGAHASRLLSGNHEIHEAVEREFCEFLGFDDAIYMVSGYQANLSLITALAQIPGTVFFCDERIHASMIDGVRLAKLDPSRKFIFAHGNLDMLSQQLTQSQSQNKTSFLPVVLTDALYSMDGDYLDVEAVLDICEKFKATLVVDEAHSFGCVGHKGAGTLVDKVKKKKPSNCEWIGVYPCGKALASQGAFIAGPKWLKEWIVNVSRPFIYATGVSPWLAACTQQSLRWVQSCEESRECLRAKSEIVRSKLTELGYNTGSGQSHIVPVILGSNDMTLKAHDVLVEFGIRCSAIRPPTVTEGTSRLRLCIHANLENQNIDQLINAFTKLREL